MAGPNFSPPPASGDFSKFIEFARLLTDPKKLNKHIDQFEKASKEYIEATKKYADALKIATTLDEANAIKECCEIEVALVKSQNVALDARLTSIDGEISVKKEKFTSDAEKVRKALEDREVAHLSAVAEFKANAAAQEEAMGRREDVLNEGEARLERELGAIKEKKARVDEAYAG